MITTEMKIDKDFKMLSGKVGEVTAGTQRAEKLLIGCKVGRHGWIH